MLALLALTLLAVPLPEMRRETSIDFAVDEAFQEAGGVQYFYEFAAPTPTPATTSALARFRALDEKSKPTDDYHVVMSRLIYTVERDLSFFTEARARDVSYLRKVAPEMGVRLEPDGSMSVSKSPSNRFRLTWYDAPTANIPELARFFEFLPPGRLPDSIVVQKNYGFARVMGWKTAERALTYTAHYSAGPGKTRIVVCSMSMLHHVPPFFLGGKNRVFRESVDGAQKLIWQLRAWKEK